MNLAYAVPAKRGFTTIVQSDGTKLQIQAFGDEFHHNVVTSDMLTVAQGADGDFYYVTPSGLSKVRAHEPGARTADETKFVTTNKEQLSISAHYEAAQLHGKLRARQNAPMRATQVPNNGTPRVPIILVQYSDKSMSNTKAQFESHYKTDAKSVYQYFVDQSNGKYTPQFDIYGIYTLPSSRATYGGNDSNGDDKGVALMVGDAITKAGNDIDWSLYDNNGDGEADVCIVVYAGVGEAQAYGIVPNAVWPCQWSLSNANYYGDGPGSMTRNGVTIDKFAVFNETVGSNDNGTTMDGIGTFCHEFSHCLGLPDFYETTYRYGYYGMGAWSLMDSGCYNGLTIDGDTPIGYSAYEKNFMGWIDYITPQENTYYTLPVFNSKNIENDQALKITALNANEYWVLENRQKQGWDQCIDDEGVMISHFTYDANRWSANTVNNQSVQLATIIPADNSLSKSSNDADLYGESNHSFTTTSSPAMKANMSAGGSISSTTGGAGSVNKPVTEITLNGDGTASLWYIKGDTPSLSAPVLDDASDVQYTSFTATWSHTSSTPCTYTLNVTQGATTVLNQTGITGNSFTVAGLTDAQTYTFKVKAVPVDATQASESPWSNVKTVDLPENPLPAIIASPASVTFTDAYATRTYTQDVAVTGKYLSQDISVSLSGADVYSINTASLGTSGGTITVTYSPSEAGQTEATLTLGNADAPTVTIPISGTAQAATPTLIVSPATLTFMSNLNNTATKTFAVTGRFISDDVTLTLSDPSGVFTLGTATIPASSISETEAVNVDVDFQSAEEGNYTGTVTITSDGAQPVTVDLTATANDGGTAHDAYLDIAKYATIDDAGANVSGMESIYKYTEYGADACAWLTLSNYGVNKTDGSQNWFSVEDVKNTSDAWNASDIFLGSESYFGSNDSYAADWTESYQHFYVTNCTQVKQYAYSRSSSYPLKIYIYECTVNGDGTVTAASGAIETLTSSNYNGAEVLTSSTLDPTKVYKISIFNDYSYLYEIGFQTELNIPALKATPNDLTITAVPGNTAQATFTVKGRLLSDDVNVTVNSQNGLFEVSPTTISVADAQNGKDVTVTFNAPDTEDIYTSTVTITSGTLSATVDITARSTNGGTASDAYLDIANYSTIDEAGSNVSEMETIFKYTEYASDYCAWLTLSTYGAYQADANQNWIQSSTFSSYNTSWSASDVLLGRTPYFGNYSSRAIYGSGDLTFYVTNCTQVKAYDSGLYNGSYKAKLSIYECTLNNDGTLTASATAVDTQQSSKSSAEVLTSITLDASKIYKVQFSGGGYYPDLYEIGFQTPLLAPKTLADVVAEADVNQTCRIVDNDIVAVHLSADGKTLYCKDDNKFATPYAAEEGQVDYVSEVGNLMDGRGYDQSNWVALHSETDFNPALLNHKLTGVEGIYTDAVNPTIELSAMPAAGEEVDTYVNNVFVPCNFISTLQQSDTGDSFFFMTPKPAEVLTVEWAMWDAAEEMFVIPVGPNEYNPVGLVGGLTADFSLYEDQMPALENKMVYHFNGVAVKTTSGSGAPSNKVVANALDNEFIVYPLNGLEVIDDLNEDIPTSIESLIAGRDVNSVIYYDLKGHVSQVPFDGVNIVEVRFADGTRKVVKFRK